MPIQRVVNSRDQIVRNSVTVDSPLTDIMVSHHRALEQAVEEFKKEFGRPPNYQELIVQYELSFGVLELTIYEEVAPPLF